MFLEDYKSFWINYTNFKGRTPRHGYWFVQLWHAIIYFCLGSLSILPYALIYTNRSLAGVIAIIVFIPLFLYSLATLIPNLSLSVRRLHDIGKSATWLWFFYSPGIATVALIIIGVMVLSISLGSFSLNLFGNYPYGSLIYPSNSINSLFTPMAGLGELLLVGASLWALLSVYSIVVSIIWIVWAATETKPNAIGVSTHNDPLLVAGYSGNGAISAAGNPVLLGHAQVAAPALRYNDAAILRARLFIKWHFSWGRLTDASKCLKSSGTGHGHLSW